MQMFVLMSYLCVSMVVIQYVQAAPQMSDAQLEKTLADRNTMRRHIKCAMGEGPCDQVGKRLRILAPLVLRGACPQCSPQETRQIRQTLAFVQRNYPWEWAKIVRQYG
ncbi:unnamed protein product [Arctia plantaginis]|uniref:Chemosensory protein n=1 Tax=Arctia plantaginis TaxID=874455 RepID=A0A8S0YQS5_ARCPL|nr:unnamed protein product [Arctia plantaginis]CAB3244632.1 unnamed protein product [Arctia plantaginis]